MALKCDIVITCPIVTANSALNKGRRLKFGNPVYMKWHFYSVPFSTAQYHLRYGRSP